MDVCTLEAEADRREAVPLLQQLWIGRDQIAVLAWTGAADYTLFGARERDELVGVAGVVPSSHLHHREVAWLSDLVVGRSDLVVDRPRRGEGIGRALVDHVEDWAAERGLHAVALASPLAKADVHGFYEARGYDRWGYVIETEI